NTVWVLCNATDEQAKSQSCSVLDRQLAVLVRLVDDLRDASQIALDRTRLQIEELILQEALETAANSVRMTADQKDVKLRVTLPTVPISIEADPSRVQQMLLNLLGNAIKYTPRNGHVFLSATLESGMAVIRV